MSFVIGCDEGTIEVDYLDIDRALCAECEKPLKWANDRKSDCCGFRYAYWTSTVSAHRVRLSAPVESKTTEAE